MNLGQVLVGELVAPQRAADEGIDIRPPAGVEGSGDLLELGRQGAEELLIQRDVLA
jgi:hypothetical protein